MTTAELVRVGVTGGVFGAPSGTALPADVDDILDVAFADLGYISEAGVTQAIATDMTTIKAWQSGDVVRKVQTSHDLTYAFAMLESSDAVLETYYGNIEAGVVEVRAEQGIRKSWVLNILDGDHRLRIVLPDAQVTERAEVKYVNGDAIMYGVTITCYPDADGVKAYIHRDDAGS